MVKQLVADIKDQKIQEKIDEIKGRLSEVAKKFNNLLDLVEDGILEAVDRVKELNYQKKRLLTEKEALIRQLGGKSDFSELNTLLTHESEYRKNYTKFNRLLQQAGYRIICDGYQITVNIPDGQRLRFKYIRFDRTKKKTKTSQHFLFLDMQTDEVRLIPRNDPITPITKDVDIESSLDEKAETVMLDTKNLEGKSIQEAFNEKKLTGEFWAILKKSQ
jgi:hypothetical protein